MKSNPGRIPPRRLIAHHLLLLLLPAALGALLASCVLELDYDKYAIVYGISDYPGTADDLYSTDDDARDIEQLLTAQGFQVVLRVTDWDTGEKEANDSQLIADFADAALTAGLDMEDLFLFYFSGHGTFTSTATSENTPGSDAEDEVLVLVDATVTGKIYLRDDQLAALLQTIPCARKIVILDSCYSGGFISNPMETDAIPPDYSDGPRGVFEILADTIRLYSNFQDYGSDIPPAEAMVIAASGERDFAYESSDGNGIMTGYLLESADSGDLNRDGYVTVTEAYHYIYKNINENFNAVVWPFSDVFFPHVTGGPVDYILFEK